MARWMKILAVALAAVIVFVPVLAYLSYAQAVSAQVVPITLPQGDELSEEELREVDGEAWPGIVPFLVKGVKWVITVLIAAERLASRGCQMAVEVVERTAIRIGDLTMRGVTFTAVKATEHPLARDTLFGAGLGVGGAALTAEIKNEPFTLKDAALGAVIGGASGALAHGLARGFEELAKRPRK